MMGADGAFTWEMVLRPDEALGGSSSQTLLQHGGNGVSLRLLYSTDGYVWLRLGSGGTLIRQQRLDALGANKYSTDGWFHLAVAYDGNGTGRFYWTKLGGSYAGTANQAGGDFSMSDLSLSDAILSFGGNANLGGSVFNGAIDEIRISDVARAPDGFLAYPPPPSLLFSEWIAGFDVGTSTSLADDPDGDGLDNLTEFALGGDPSNPDDTGYAPSFRFLEENGTNWFEYVHAKRINAGQPVLTYRVEQTTDLVYGEWTAAGIEVAGTGELAAGEFVAVTNRAATDPHAKQFLRTVIEAN